MGLVGKVLVLVGLMIIIHAGYSSEQCKCEKIQRVSDFDIFWHIFYYWLSFVLVSSSNTWRLFNISLLFVDRTYLKLIEEEFTSLPKDVRECSLFMVWGVAFHTSSLLISTSPPSGNTKTHMTPLQEKTKTFVTPPHFIAAAASEQGSRS